MSAAAAGVWALVCGLPPGRREKTLLFMLQAFVDESRSEGSPSFFVLGGYIASAETWAAFAGEWQRALDMRPRIRYFKLGEAQRATGEFLHMSEGLRIERIKVMRSVIEQFEPRGFALYMRLDDLEAVYANRPKQLRNPYYMSVALLIPELARVLEPLGLPRDRLDFIFDNQVIEKGQIVQAFEEAKAETTKAHPPDLLTTILKGTPRWDDDKTVLPLQAADMHTTWARQILEAELQGRRRELLPGTRKSLPLVFFPADRQALERHAAKAHARRSRDG